MEVGPGTVIDRYTVESALGEGGMAVVYKVRHNTLQSLHALKVLTITSPTIKQRLLQEGRVQGQLRHPNVVSVTDVVQVGDAPGLVLEFVEGPTLDAYIANERPTIAQADALAQGILDGVAAAHAKGLVHRDLKPGNILLQVSPTGPVPKICDFGLAKLHEAEPGGWTRTLAGSAMGTPHYMSPEQIRDTASVGPSTDVFALGAILYELVTGCRAFDGPDMLSIFNAVALGKYVPPKQLVPDLPERMERAIVKALEIDPARRIATVEELHAIWNGEQTGPWDPKTIDRIAVIAPPSTTRNTRFSFARVTQFGTGAVLGGGALLAVAGLAAIAVALILAVGVGWFEARSASAPLVTPPAAAEVAASSAPDAPAKKEVVDPATLPIVGPPAPPPPAEAAPVPAGGGTAANPWGSAAPTSGGRATTVTARGGKALPPELLADPPSARSAALDGLASDPAATWMLGEVMKTDGDNGVSRKAAKILVDRWARGIGDPAEHAALVAWAARSGSTDLRLTAIAALGERGANLVDLAPALAHPQPTVRRAAADAVVAIARRTGNEPAARSMLEAQAAHEDDSKTQKKLAEALKSL